MTDMQKLQDEGERCCSLLWHQVALCAGSVSQQLTSYQKAITSLTVRPLIITHTDRGGGESVTAAQSRTLLPSSGAYMSLQQFLL